MAREQLRQPEAVRITSAAASRHEDIASRQRKYLLSMSLRTICFIGAIIASLLEIHWLWPILIVGALVLPYIAVVLANASTMRSEPFDLLDPGPRHRELGPGGQNT